MSNYNYKFNNVNDALPVLMGELLRKGDMFGSRAGKTLELMHVGITLGRPWQREIVIPERKANIAAQIVETMWILSGRNDVAGLAHYLPRAVDFSDDGIEWRAGYGPRLRNYHGVDQLACIVDTIADNPGSRQAVATIWDPTVDTTPGKDIACNNWLSFSARDGKVDLHVGIRSNDAMWGWSGINAFEWSCLLELVACLASLQVGSLHFATTSFHLYEQHWLKAKKISEIEGSFLYSDSPRMSLGGRTILSTFDELAQEWFELEESIRFGHGEYGAQIEAFPDPMLKSWLQVLQWYWTGDTTFLQPLQRTRLHQACMVGMKPAGTPQDEQMALDIVIPPERMITHINRLHDEKHAAYGDSWKRRGEYMILANIARKIDRIDGGVDTSDETQADTAQDLLVYLCKYSCWLDGGTGDPDEVATLLAGLAEHDAKNDLVNIFAELEKSQDDLGRKKVLVTIMINQAYTLARSLWR